MRTPPALQYVGYSRRGTALFIDSIWWTLLALFIPVGPSISLTDPASLFGLFSATNLLWMTLSQCIPLVVTGVLWAVTGTSPGKMALGLHIVDDRTGFPMSAGQAGLRTIGYIACFMTCGLGFMPMFFTKKKQGLHDLIANTVVVEKAVINLAEFPARKPRP
jgi:uncharacterized RDD family membrane protein YckC